MKKFRIVLMSLAVMIAVGGAFASTFSSNAFAVTGWAHNPNASGACQSRSDLSNSCSISNNGANCTIVFAGADDTPQTAYNSQANCSDNVAANILQLP